MRCYIKAFFKDLNLELGFNLVCLWKRKVIFFIVKGIRYGILCFMGGNDGLYL